MKLSIGDAIQLTHIGGCIKTVRLFNISLSATGRPLRAMIIWPSAGLYSIDLKNGKLLGAKRWHADASTLARINELAQTIWNKRTTMRKGRGVERQ